MQLATLWKQFLAYQAQFHARDFVTFNPRDNKARFIKIIRALVKHPSFSNLGVDIEVLIHPDTAKVINSPAFAQMQTLCELIEANDAFTLKETNTDEQAAIMVFKSFNSAQWAAYIKSSDHNKKIIAPPESEVEQSYERPVQSPSKKNTRRRTDPLLALALDVDLQQQSDIQNTFQLQSLQSTEYQNEQQFEAKAPTEKDPAISFDEFWAIITADKSQHPLKTKKDDLRYQWCHWSAGQNTCQNDNKRSPTRKLIDGDIQFTRDAAMELFKWRHLFQAGIDIHHLPAGFSITRSKNTRDEDVYLLNYLPKLKELVEPDKLAIQCTTPVSFPSKTSTGLTLEEVMVLFKDYRGVNEESFKPLYDRALKYFPDVDTLQNNDEYMHAVQIILSLPPSQRVWWEQLYEQHTNHCGQDNFPSLVTSFQEFLQEVTQYHQYFDFYPPKFTNIKSMPIALTQMLALLDQSEHEDRQTQWNCITELQLTGYEVGKALRTSHFARASFNEIQHPCSFIVPAMHVEEISDFKGRFDLLFPSKHTWSPSELIPEHQNTERLFYLALSHKPFRLPLSFYQKQFKAINKTNLDEDSKKRLCFFLLESCTGTRSTFILKSPEKISAQWALFISNINLLGNKADVNKITEELFKFTDIPEIQLLNKVIKIVSTKTGSNPEAEMKQVIFYLNRLASSWDTRKAHQLINVLDNLSIEHLWDMKVLFEGQYNQPNYLSLALVFNFLPALDYSKDDKPIRPGQAVRFSKKLSEVLDEREKDERSYFLADRILDKLSCLTLSEGQPSLTVEQFIAFSRAVFNEASAHQTEESSEPILNVHARRRSRKSKNEFSFESFYNNSEFIDPILREHFPEHVDESLLELSELSTDDFTKLELRIKTRVKDKSAQAVLKAILTELSFDRSLKNGHSDLVDRLITLTNNYPGEERAEFLLTIRNHLSFGKLLSKEDNRGFESRLDQLNELIQTIIDTGSIIRFQFLMAELEPLSEPNNRNVMKKLSYALRRVLGLMNEGLASNPHIQSTEQLLFCKEFISAHSAKSLLQSPNQNETLFIEMIQSINKTSEQYSTHARAINAFFIRCYETMNKIDLSSSLQRTTELSEQLSALKAPDLVLSIIHTFVAKDNNDLFSIQSLEQLFKNTPKEKLSEFFKILIDQNNQNSQNVNKDNIESFLSLMKNELNNEQFSEALTLCFSRLPLPTFEVFTEWWTTVQNNPADEKHSIKEQYRTFIQQPFPRDDKNNGFKIEKALEQVKSPEMANIATRYTDEFIEEFYKKSIYLRQLSLTDLMNSLQSAQVSSDPALLTITMAELLFRSTGQEINTTQYLAIDSLLSSGKHVISEIDTGEGKTRIAMLLLACRACSGQTCDFVTSDMQLAETAYLSYHSFFKMLGIKCTLIRSESNIEEYQPGAIHFSDCGNLSLFRNKATAIGQLDKTLDPDPKHRTLLLDESDKTWFDLYDTSYNFSMPADKTLEDVEWVYTQLIQFFSEDGYQLNPEVMNDYYDDVERCTKKFREFVKLNGTRLQVAQLSSISNEQIARWHESAVTALSLRYQIDFAVEANCRVKTNKGPKVASEALVVADNQVNRHSKFSNGVHQCLHARLNILRHKGLHEQSTALDTYLHEKCTQAFHIAPENQIITTSSSETFLNFYGEGNTYGMTGTAGTETEKREVEEHFGVADDPNQKHFIKMPRQKTNLRIDNPITVVSQNSDKIALLLEHIIKAQSKNQPILIFCDNDREATLITEQLNKQLQTIPDDVAKGISLKQIKSTTSLEDQRTYLVSEGGKPGAVTISTGMLGRGKDILLHSIDSPKRDAAEYGLKTIDLSYPNYRELKQRLGRAARNGQPGETYVILSEEELKTKYKLRYSESNLQLIESLLVKRQRFETDKNQLERRIKITLHEYLGQYQKAYFNILLPLLKKNHIDVSDHQNTLWVSLFNEMILMKQKALNDLMGIIHSPSFSVQKFQLITDELHTSIQLKWDEGVNKLIQDPTAKATIKPLVNKTIHPVELQDWEKNRTLEIKNEQLRPLRERIIIDEIKANESFWVFLNRKLYEFAQWSSWGSLAKYLDARFRFSRPIHDNEIEPLIFSPDKVGTRNLLGSHSIIQSNLEAHNEVKGLASNTSLKEPVHADLFKQKAKPEEQKFVNKPNANP